MPRPLTPPIERFLAFAFPEPNSGCWLWSGEVSNNGYGRLLVKTDDKWSHISAHRFSYQEFVDDIPPFLVIDHKCRNRLCVNPVHLRAITTRDNVLCGAGVAADNARRTHCRYGHEFTQENTEYYGRRRRCRICRKNDCRKRRGS